MKIPTSSILLIILSLLSCTGNQNEWIDMFNGKDLAGWNASESPASFRVEEGALVCSGNRGHLYYNETKPFKNFELVAEIKTLPLANSGIYFHTAFQETDFPALGYEVQVNNTHIGADNYRETKKTGSLYAVRNVHYQMVKDGEWFTMRVKVVENHVEVFVNDHKVVDYIQPDNPWRSEEHKGRLLGSGTFALQAHDEKSTVYYKSIKVKRLPDGEKLPLAVDEEWETAIARLMDTGFPLVDYHVHLKGGLTLEEVKANSLKLGINYGLAPNCGLKFPVTDDASLAAYMDTVKGQPIFRGMQAEGREWIT